MQRLFECKQKNTCDGCGCGNCRVAKHGIGTKRKAEQARDGTRGADAPIHPHFSPVKETGDKGKGQKGETKNTWIRQA